MIKWIIELLNSARCGRCADCDSSLPLYYRLKYSGLRRKNYCPECLNKYKICYLCGDVCSAAHNIGGVSVCEVCLLSRVLKCDRCNKIGFDRDMYGHNNGTYCSECYKYVSKSFRAIDIGQSKSGSDTFKNNPCKRYVGIEIECLNNDRAMNSFISKELKIFKFSQGTDGSLDYGGVEFRSVPMNGDLLFNSVDSFCRELNARNYRVNSSCGLHIHLEVEKELEYLKKIYLFYLRFEEMFFNMLPKSRRNISFCQRFREYYSDKPKDIIDVDSMDKFLRMIYETSYYGQDIRSQYHDKRYCWANLHSIFYRGTLEIRNHSGTINPAKIINWITIHNRVLDFLKDVKLQEVGVMPVNKKTFLGIFDKSTQSYIKRRWKTFISMEEKDMNAREPIYISANRMSNKMRARR